MPAEGMDYVKMEDAILRLMTDVMQALRAIKPDILIEFRQSYIGPAMRTFGNMFRVADCPYDPLTNRVGVVDLRLMSGDTAVHSDMLMWHADEPVEVAARQLLNVLFGVPQISVRLDKVSEEHRRMLAFWTAFFAEHRALLAAPMEVESPELLYPLVRTRLGLLWDYVKLTANHVKDTRWVFTDGSFDDALGLELRARGQRQTGLVSVMSGHTPYETFLRVRTAQDAEDKPMLEAGGGEALRFWVNEKNEHLRASAVQVGFEALKRCRDVHPRPAGLAMRVPSSPSAALAFDAADGETVAFSDLALQVASRPGGALAGFDRSVAEKFDFMLWRLARMADQRALAFARRDNVQSMAEQRDLSHALDQANLSARILDGKLERLKPTEGVVLTPREGLWVSLKRADFDLARRYAVMVLRTQPQDVDANFALGMWALETHEYMRAVRYLQAVLRQKPNEPTVLNNLALAYLKLNFFTEAFEHAERAVALFPSSEELRRNLDRIRKARDEGAAEGCAEAASKKDEPKNEDEAKSVLQEVVKPVKIKDAPPAPKKDAKKDAKKPVPAKPVAAPERG